MAQVADAKPSTENRLDIIDLAWEDLPFRDDAEKKKVQEFGSYLSEKHGMDGKSLKPFEMAIFFLGKGQNNEEAAKQYMTYLKFANQHKFDQVTDKTLDQSITLLRNMFALGGRVKDEKSGKEIQIFGTSAAGFVPSLFESTGAMVKGLYYLWNECNFYRKFDISRQSVTIVADMTGFGMKNFKLSAQTAAMDLMQKIYPMGLDTMYMMDAPFMMSAVVAIILKLIDTGSIKVVQGKRKEAFEKIGGEVIPTISGGKFLFDPKAADEQEDVAADGAKQEKSETKDADAKPADSEDTKTDS